MPQSTNLNVNPYYSDFDDSKNYYKILFKPGVSVQTRELNNLQSILQNQIEKFGSSFYSHGGVVIPGNYAYDQYYECVEVEDNFSGVSVETYSKDLIGYTIKGKNSNVKAKIDFVLNKSDVESTRNTVCLYVKYVSSSSEDFSKKVFDDGEDLVLEEDYSNGSTVFLSGTSVFRTLNLENRKSTSVGSVAKIEDGVYFIRGYFVNVSSSTLILDPYTNTPSYRVGLNVVESIIDSDDDNSLTDNSKGFSNFSAPGADRLKIQAPLIKKDLDNFDDDNFIELFRVENGVLTKILKKNQYEFINDILARRTYDESGNYSVNQYTIEALESLNDRVGNLGLYLSDEKTSQGSDPSDDLAILKISPGKSYVKGYEVPTSTVLLDYEKPRELKEVESSSTVFSSGNIVKINNITGSPNIGLSTNYYVNLYNRRLTDGAVGSATTIGFAKVYDFEYDNVSYENESSIANLYLFDIQTFTDITVNSAITGLSVGDYIVGNNSNASGFVQNVSGTDITLYQTSGEFQQNESLIVSGIATSRTVSSVVEYSSNNIKSVSGSTGTFLADLSLPKETSLSGPFTIDVDGSSATITKSDGSSFATPIIRNDIIKYVGVGLTLPIFTRVTNINSTKASITVQSISSVDFVCDGGVGVSTTLQNISIIRPEISNQNNSALFSELENQNISEVSLLNSSIYTKKQYTVNISSNSITLPDLSNTDFVYSPFDEENYVLVDGSNNNLNLESSNFSFNTGFKGGTITGLSVATSNNSKLIVTLIKSNVTSKYKKVDKCRSITVNRSKYSPASNALTYSKIYGTRVEDIEISLNRPDIVEVHAVYESVNNLAPVPPSITISGTNTGNLVLGELVIGQESNAVAICAEFPSSSLIYLVYKNSNKFIAGESITFVDSELTSTVTSVDPGVENILEEFSIDNGQRNHFYDYGRLIRKESSKEPSRKLKIYFDCFIFESSDLGEVITVNSYPSDLYGKKIPVYSGLRNTDVIDIRPRVENYSTGSLLSPFDFGSRTYSTESNNSTVIIKSNEPMIFDYSFYLPRTDKLTLDTEGYFSIVYGNSSINPSTPEISEEVLDVATINSSAYVYDINSDITITLSDNRRYTMSDIRDIEKRVENLEYYTSLSLLELSTESLSVTDSEGFDRFKSGFFVDNFSSYSTSDTNNLLFRSEISNNTLTCEKNTSTVSLKLYNTVNTKETSNSITLDYVEVDYIKQSFASRIVNVNPFNIATWSGKLELNPSSDYWTIVINESEQIADVNKQGQEEVTATSKFIDYIRSRNIKFLGTRLKPNTAFNFIFDSRNLSSNVNGTTYAFPKLLEISDVTGTFVVGETVNGYDNNGNTVSFRICSPNHKSGPHNNPTTTYSVNPYNPSVGISTVYGPQSTILNVDVDTLQSTSDSSYFGNIVNEMSLYGTSSNALATVSNLRLVTDDNGTLQGSLFIPDPNNNTIKYKTGSTTAKLTEVNTTTTVPGQTISSAETTFTSKGSEVTIKTIGYYDPLAQSFFVNEENGVFLSSVDVFFNTKDTDIPVSLQIREVFGGVPGGSDKIVGNLEKVLMPSEVSTSNNASVPTTFTFDKLHKLEGNKEYAIVLLSDSNNYNVWVSRVGEVEISTANLPEVQKVIINKQPSLGSLFISQNGSTWTPTQEDDLKFTIKKCKFSTSSATVRLQNSTVSTKSLNNRLPKNPIVALSDSGVDLYHDGNHILVNHPNHGMYSENNKVVISGVFPDTKPSKLSSNYSITSTSSIPIPSGDTSNYTSYNGSPVDPNNNPGYILMNDEIIKYTGTSSGELTGITRGMFGTKSQNHSANSLIHKYQFNGVALSRINKQFDSIKDPTIDTYYVEIGAGSYGFENNSFGGGSKVYASRNIQFSSIDFEDNFVTLHNSTSVTSSVRTVSSTSVDGSETSFADLGFETVGISSINYFTTPRMVCSRVNELEFLPSSQFADQKSLTLELNLSTTDENVSPVVDLDNALLFVENNRINAPIGANSYPTDSRVNSSTNDPHSFIYISKKVDLESDSSSLKVLLSAYRHSSSDIRVLYKLYRDDSSDTSWNLFPGYLNIDNNGNIIDQSDNDGRPDTNVPESLNSQYRDYTFTIDDLTPFSAFSIKIVGTSTNQAYSPIIKDLRVIALR